ncbi:hypothetical protein LTR36_005695 [Oleoguttula mirabilis]|uniref:Uncharacterized protein n=1 Tax=Oleoguttula mirabilis TaxID=1507867 RepID=A0AAV9JEM7_9PEZI|nr:hypothetical protein LTR36_005695 [Oleoguttula mirabilis]
MDGATVRKSREARRSASSSSDILVGPAAPLAEVKENGLLIVRLGKEALLTILNGDNGPNERGTYSRQYTLRHPNVQWVHRGQGRYLPADEIKREAVPIPQRRSRHSRPQQDALDDPTVKAEPPEDDDEDFLIQEQLRAIVAKRVPLTRSQDDELRVKERLQAITSKRNDGKRKDPTPQPPKRSLPPDWMMKLVQDGVMAQLSSRRNARPEIKPKQQFPASPYEDLSNIMPLLPGATMRQEYGREEISATRLDKFRLYVDRLILIEADAGSTFATSNEEPQSPVARPPRKRRAHVDTLSDSLTLPPTYGLRHRLSEPQPQTPSGMEERAARLARRAKPMHSIEKSARATLRAHHSAPSQGVFSDSEDEDSDNMGEDGDKTPTYSRQYVEEHDPDDFYHTGNGWYKKGPRPQGKTKDRRESDAPILRRERVNSYTFDGDRRKSYHKEELDKYPGEEFHHCGNGYYRPGPDPAGKRASVIISNSHEDGEAEGDEDGAAGGTVSKEYKEAHPEILWVHRGNGRYVRKVEVAKDSTRAHSLTPTAPSVTGRRKSEPTFDKAYVHAHPAEDFYHTGNARYKRGNKPNGRQNLAEEESEEEDDDPTALYDKAHVEAHPHQVFHHRGQGRYARGPRPTTTPARDNHEEEDDSDDDMESNTLVDTSFVDSHPELTFYHKGQGRWARGLPPPGSHNKVAVRGPGAKERMAARGSEEEEEDEAEKAPAVTALVTRGEGPEKFPTLTWHYRGGGKWGRITKQEWSQMTAETVTENKVTTSAKYKRRSNKASDGAEAQLAREAAAAAKEAGRSYANDEMDIDAAPLAEKPKQRRGRKSQRGPHQAQEELAGSKDSSKPNSKPTTPPKPRIMLRPDEDIVNDEDLLPVFGSKWCDIAPTEDSEVARVYRKNFMPLQIDQTCNLLNRHEPEVRSLDTLARIAAHCGTMLAQLQEEYIALDRIIAPHAKIPRKPAKGGRLPVDPAVFEDRKEAELYDYVFDPRKIGFQDPEAQRIVRDAEGRELRKRRNRSGIEPTDTVPGWHFGEGTELATKRQSRQPNRFDAGIEPARKRARTAYGGGIGIGIGINGHGNGNAESMTPDRAATPLLGPGGYRVQTAGRWAGHVPKRVRELRDNSVGSARSQNDGGGSEAGGNGKVRKGRPPGSKNLHKRSDAGIKKGPRRPKVVPSIEASPASPAAGAGSVAVDWEGGGGDGDAAAGEFAVRGGLAGTTAMEVEKAGGG